MTELDINLAQLVKKSQVSKLVIRELREGDVVRKRSPRTLEAVSVALELHPQYLWAISKGEPPLGVDDPVVSMDDSTTVFELFIARVNKLEKRLDTIDLNGKRMEKSLRWLIENTDGPNKPDLDPAG
ncbi:hypothetical protein [Actinokineospora inagensis]|uniref:hypothetical protein n=1 Tax=Actinokineospora inagensis TaxID=103730 RepID=UPI000421EEDC|nr:hypothetical protein [Actinokineospora inagensis]